MNVWAQAANHGAAAADQRFAGLALAAIKHARASVDVDLPGEAGTAETLGDLSGALDRRVAPDLLPQHVVGACGPHHDAEEEIVAAALLSQLDNLHRFPHEVEGARRVGIAGKARSHHSKRGQQAGFGVPEASADLLGARSHRP